MQHSKSIFLITLSFALTIPAFAESAYAEVWIPEHEYIGFFDSNGIYTVVGAVKNSENFPVIPTISITIQDGENIISQDFEYTNIMPSKELPFKFQFNEIQSMNPILVEPEINYIRGMHNPSNVEVIYDESLIVHSDGHLTGKIINTGSKTISGLSLLAIIHGYEHETLDMGKNLEPIHDLKPGEIREFKMYPDPSVSSEVWYYSCFAVGDDTIIVLNTERNGQTYTIRYDSGILISYPDFNEKETELSFRVIEGWTLENYYLNLELPQYSSEEEFEVLLNDEHVDSIQSIDEFGNWHVGFTLEEQASGKLVVKGFDPHGTPTITTLIPDWIRNNAGWWSQEKISNSDFISGIEFLLEHELIVIPATERQVSSDSIVPDWVRNNAGWWSQGLISDDDFTSGLQYLIANGIISV